MKRKDEDLTPQEAVHLAQKQEMSRWYFSSPLFAVVAGEPEEGSADPNHSTLEVFPLDRSLNKKDWIMAFVDPTHPEGVTLLRAMQMWRTRYLNLPVEFLVIYTSRFAWMAEPSRRDAFVRRERLGFPILVDQGGDLLAAFDVSRVPSVQLRHHGKQILLEDQRQWDRFELALQSYLRQSDPGLALFDPIAAAEFRELVACSPLRTEDYQWNGKWEHRLDPVSGVVTHVLAGGAGSVSMPLQGSHLWLVAESKRAERILGAIEIDGAPAFEVFLDEPRLEVMEARLYRLLRGVPSKHKTVKLQFQVLSGQELRLYSLQFCRTAAPEDFASAAPI